MPLDLTHLEFQRDGRVRCPFCGKYRTELYLTERQPGLICALCLREPFVQKPPERASRASPKKRRAG